MDSLCHSTIKFQIRNSVVSKIDIEYTINEDKTPLLSQDPISLYQVSLTPTSSKPIYQYTFNEVAEMSQHGALNTVLPQAFVGYSTSMLTLTGSVLTEYFDSGSTAADYNMDWYPSPGIGYYPIKITSGSS